LPPTIGIVYFPGTNCEFDVAEALERLGGAPRLVWHGVDDLEGLDAFVLPGGFAHGDYLRPGAIARFSAVMEPLSKAALAGLPVLGICNGFQVLTEAGLLPGALQRNDGLRFICEMVSCLVEGNDSILTRGIAAGTKLRLPINHYEGNYTVDPATLALLERRHQIVLRYAQNPNGSIAGIAGVANEQGNVVGLMPHPERASDALLGSEDGKVLLQAFIDAAERDRSSRRRA
jgi:phosphoribosylformylglycinamidine synthase